MLDPRFKKLSFDGDNMLKPAMRRDAVTWLTEEYNSKFKGKAHDATAAADPRVTEGGVNADGHSATARAET